MEESTDEDGVAFMCNIAQSVQSVSDPDSITFYLDSGASDHLISDKSCLLNVKFLQEPIKIRVAKAGEELVGKIVGDVRAISVFNGQVSNCIIKNVIYVPDLRANLLSVGRIEKNGLKVVFEVGMVRIFLGSKVIPIGVQDGNLYKIKLKLASSKITQANMTCTRETINLWHRWLGHLNEQYMQQLKTMSDNLKISKADNFQCETCIMAKHEKKPFKGHRTRATKPLQIIHTNVCGPITPKTWDNKRYILTFFDDFRHFTVVYLLETKAQVYEFFQSYEAMVTSKFSHKIMKLRCDNRGEYSSNLIKNFCEQKGILLEYTTAYTPQMNGQAERLNRSLIEKARAMIIDSSIPKCF